MTPIQSIAWVQLRDALVAAGRITKRGDLLFAPAGTTRSPAGCSCPRPGWPNDFRCVGDGVGYCECACHKRQPGQQWQGGGLLTTPTHGEC